MIPIKVEESTILLNLVDPRRNNESLRTKLNLIKESRDKTDTRPSHELSYSTNGSSCGSYKFL